MNRQHPDLGELKLMPIGADIGDPLAHQILENVDFGVQSDFDINLAYKINLEVTYEQLITRVAQQILQLDPRVQNPDVIPTAVNLVDKKHKVDKRYQHSGDLSVLYGDGDQVFLRTKICGPVDIHENELLYPSENYVAGLLEKFGVDKNDIKPSIPIQSNQPNIWFVGSADPTEYWIIQDATELCNTELAPAIKKLLTRGI